MMGAGPETVGLIVRRLGQWSVTCSDWGQQHYSPPPEKYTCSKGTPHIMIIFTGANEEIFYHQRGRGRILAT